MANYDNSLLWAEATPFEKLQRGYLCHSLLWPEVTAFWMLQARGNCDRYILHGRRRHNQICPKATIFDKLLRGYFVAGGCHGVARTSQYWLNFPKCCGHPERSWNTLRLVEVTTVRWGPRPQCLIYQREAICGQRPHRVARWSQYWFKLFKMLWPPWEVIKHTGAGGGCHSSLGTKAIMFNLSKRGYLQLEVTTGLPDCLNSDLNLSKCCAHLETS